MNAIKNLTLLDTGMNQSCNVSCRGKRPFALTQIHASIQQHQKLKAFANLAD